MKVLLVHLSDLHIKTERYAVLDRADAVVSAVKDMAYGLDLAIVAVTGDVAYSGQPMEYLAAGLFLDSIVRGLRQQLRSTASKTVNVHLAIVPGNHDCDFPDDQAARESGISTVLAQPDAASKSSMVTLCTGVQDAFFQFLVDLGIERVAATSYSDRLSWSVVHETDSGRIRVIALNTAWLSRRHEEQGELSFPPEAVPERFDDVYTVALLHHPYAWIEHSVGHAFRNRLEQTADLILSGHEHDPAYRSIVHPRGQSLHIEAGPFQDRGDTAVSVFRCLVLDLEQQQKTASSFEWRDGHYEQTQESGWGPLDTIATRKLFELTSETRSFIADPGVTLVKAGRILSFDDVFFGQISRKSLSHPVPQRDEFAAVPRFSTWCSKMKRCSFKPTGKAERRRSASNCSRRYLTKATSRYCSTEKIALRAMTDSTLSGWHRSFRRSTSPRRPNTTCRQIGRRGSSSLMITIGLHCVTGNARSLSTS